MPGNEYAGGLIEHDGDVAKLLKALDDLGITDNTIVVYTTENGPNQFSWPDAATTPFRSEKDTNWEGAFRVPAAVSPLPGQGTATLFIPLNISAGWLGTVTMVIQLPSGS